MVGSRCAMLALDLGTGKLKITCLVQYFLRHGTGEERFKKREL